jgi:MraZ protein
VEQSGKKGVLRGTYTARIDVKGRLKIPNAFRSLIEREHGAELFVTSLTGEDVQIFPMSIWVALEERLGQMPSAHPSRLKYIERANYFGQVAEIDSQGRVIIHPRLRDSAGMIGEVDVLGQYDRLHVWNHERYLARLQREPFTDADARAVSEFGI